MVPARIELPARWKYDQRPIKTQRHLAHVVDVRVEDEGAGTRWCHADDEGILRRDDGCGRNTVAAPTRDAVMEAFQLNAMPVNRGCH